MRFFFIILSFTLILGCESSSKAEVQTTPPQTSKADVKKPPVKSQEELDAEVTKMYETLKSKLLIVVDHSPGVLISDGVLTYDYLETKNEITLRKYSKSGKTNVVLILDKKKRDYFAMDGQISILPGDSDYLSFNLIDEFSEELQRQEK